MQIDVKNVDALKNLAICNLYTGDRCVKIAMAHSDYLELIQDGFFVRDGKEADSAAVINTTHVYHRKGEKDLKNWQFGLKNSFLGYEYEGTNKAFCAATKL